jgi:hypothetical protein
LAAPAALAIARQAKMLVARRVEYVIRSSIEIAQSLRDKETSLYRHHVAAELPQSSAGALLD